MQSLKIQSSQTTESHGYSLVCVCLGGGELQAVEGNPHRSVWKVCCWRMAEEVRKLYISGKFDGKKTNKMYKITNQFILCNKMYI